MDETTELGASDLNLKEQEAQAQTENKRQEKRAKYEIARAINLEAGYEVVDVLDLEESVPLGGMVSRDPKDNRTFVVIAENKKKQTRQTILLDNDLNKLATIHEDSRIELSDQMKKDYAEYIYDSKGLTTADGKTPPSLDRHDLSKDYYLERDEEGKLTTREEDRPKDKKKTKQEKEPDEKTDEKNLDSLSKDRELTDKEKMAMALGVKTSQIRLEITIGDAESKAAMLKKQGMKFSRVKFVQTNEQSSAKMGFNQWRALEIMPDGSYKKLDIEPDMSEPLTELARELSISSDTQNQRHITDEELTAEYKEGTLKDERNIVINKTTLTDGRIVVMMIDNQNTSDVHVFEERENNLLVPLDQTHEHPDEIQLESGTAKIALPPTQEQQVLLDFYREQTEERIKKVEHYRETYTEKLRSAESPEERKAIERYLDELDVDLAKLKEDDRELQKGEIPDQEEAEEIIEKVEEDPHDRTERLSPYDI